MVTMCFYGIKEKKNEVSMASLTIYGWVLIGLTIFSSKFLLPQSSGWRKDVASCKWASFETILQRQHQIKGSTLR